uniref:Tigit protein n=1 Tax=Fopius arisanus TaxID=64838 RepID=A0A0C9R2Q8_9HYME
MRMIFFFAIVIFWNFFIAFGFDAQIELSKYCRDKDRLITSDELDEYLLVDAELNSTLGLECHFCNEPSDDQPRMWYFQDRLQEKEEREVDLGMSNNMSSNRIHLTPELNLIIKDFELKDAGIYRCHGPLGQNMENKFNYRIERELTYL